MQALHDEHAAALWAFAVRLTGGDRQAAEDVVQETLLRAWRHPNSPAFSSEQVGSARGWLYTVARRIVIDEWRARSVRPERLVADLPDPLSVDHTDALVESRLIADALLRLTARTPGGAGRDVLPALLGPRDRRTAGDRRGHREITHPLRAAGAETGPG